MAKKKQIKRIMRASFVDGTHTDFEITKAVCLKLDDPSDKRVYLESLPDGTFRLMWTDGLLRDFSQLEAFTMIREGGPNDEH